MVGRGLTVPRLIGASIFFLALSLSACSSPGNVDSTASTHGTHGTHGTDTAPPGRALNVTPCNYAQVWLNDPSHFSEFATLARFARTAANTDLRSQGRQLAAAVSANDASTISGVMNSLVSTCEHLGLAHSPTTTSTGPARSTTSTTH
jgi:hypothetical protein